MQITNQHVIMINKQAVLLLMSKAASQIHVCWSHNKGSTIIIKPQDEGNRLIQERI